MNQPTRGFKRKTIEKLIQNKINHWVKFIEDEKLRKDVLNDYIVTGGSIVSMLQGQMPNDFDIYFKTPEIAKRVAEYYLGKIPKGNYKNEERHVTITTDGDIHQVQIFIKSQGVASEANVNTDYEYFEHGPWERTEAFFLKLKKVDKRKKYAVRMISTNAITLSDDIQIITRFVGDPEKIHQYYDFVHCTNYYTPNTGLVLIPAALESIITKDLKYVGSKYPVCSMFRIRKFIQRGWSITAGEMLKIAYDISHLDLNDRCVLQEQLVGVDAAYFFEMLDILKSEDRNVDRSYLFEVINRVFDGKETAEDEKILDAVSGNDDSFDVTGEDNEQTD